MRFDTRWLWGAAGALVLGGLALARARRRRLRRRVVLITGGSRGLGLELARQLGARGARIAICGRDPSTLTRAEDDLKARGVDVFARACDVTDRAQVARLIADVRSHLGPIDVLINNAGRIDVGPFELMNERDYEESLDLHFRAPLVLMEAVVPEMKERRRGHIVNVASFAGRVAIPHMASYVVGKHALVGLSRAARLELRPHGITVTTVLPGLIRTGSHVRAYYKGQHRAEYAWFAVGMALRGMSISPERAARAIRRAISRRQSEVVLGAPARLGRVAQSGAPRVTERVLAGIARSLPAPGGIGQLGVTGAQSESAFTRGRWARRLREAERRFNQKPTARLTAELER